MRIIMMNGGGWCEIIISKIPHYKTCLFAETPNGKLQHFSEVSIQCLQQPSEFEILQIWVNIYYGLHHIVTPLKAQFSKNLISVVIYVSSCVFKLVEPQIQEQHENEKTKLPSKLQLSQLFNRNDAKISVNCLTAV